MGIRQICWSAILAAGLAAPGLTQEIGPAPVKQDEGKTDGPRIEGGLPISPDDRVDELTKLFAEVELRLGRIDQLLTDASAGETSKLAEVGESGIEDLLDSAQDSSSSSSSSSSSPSSEQNSQAGLGGMLQRSASEGQEVLRGIDQIIEVASRP
ncbi:MAG: hypothetical protein ACI841_000856 [Planctomycetota bacterium]|jgi:hypothetical protein